MTQKDFFAEMEDVRRLRMRIMERIARDAEALKNVYLAELEGVLSAHPNLTLQGYTELIGSEIRISKGMARSLLDRLRQGQRQLAQERMELFSGIMESVPNIPVENLQALYSVNFPKINGNVASQLRKAMTQVITRGGSYRDVVVHLRRETDIVAYQARTLANTAVAGFDNAYQFEIAGRTGIETFRYAGMAAQRPFCQERLGGNYTRSEINRMDNGQGLPVFAYCGGYNCVHQWVPNPFAR